VKFACVLMLSVVGQYIYGFWRKESSIGWFRSVIVAPRVFAPVRQTQTLPWKFYKLNNLGYVLGSN